MDISFIGELVNGALNKYHKPITYVRNIHWTNQSSNNPNTTYIVVKDLKSTLQDYSNPRSWDQQYGHH